MHKCVAFSLVEVQYWERYIVGPHIVKLEPFKHESSASNVNVERALLPGDIGSLSLLLLKCMTCITCSMCIQWCSMSTCVPFMLTVYSVIESCTLLNVM